MRRARNGADRGELSNSEYTLGLGDPSSLNCAFDSKTPPLSHFCCTANSLRRRWFTRLRSFGSSSAAPPPPPPPPPLPDLLDALPLPPTFGAGGGFAPASNESTLNLAVDSTFGVCGGGSVGGEAHEAVMACVAEGSKHQS